jgi:hypothetical protein
MDDQTRDEMRDEMFDEQMSEQEVVEEIQDIKEQLTYLENHPDEFLAFGMVCALTNETTRVEECDCGSEHIQDGFILRLINPRGHEGYHDISELLRDLDTFDQKAEELKLRGEERGPEVVGIGAMLGGEGGPFG